MKEMAGSGICVVPGISTARNRPTVIPTVIMSLNALSDLPCRSKYCISIWFRLHFTTARQKSLFFELRYDLRGKRTKQVFPSDREKSMSTLLTATRMQWKFSRRPPAYFKIQGARGVQGDPRDQDAPEGKAIGTRSVNNSRRTEP